MVVYRKEPNDLDPHTGTTAAQSVDQTSNEAEKSSNSTSLMVPRAILTSRPNSHPFQERHLVLDQPVKVGRSVARCRPAPNNAIFDCKVLSRNHALLWYENGKFYLQDTKSSNGTFVNNQRLSKGSEESPAREVCSGDIVQFGVDVVENSRKVTHGCIVATLRLYLPDGKEAKASPTTTVVPAAPETSISSQDLYQLSQFLQEALHREQVLESKLVTLQRVVSNTQDESDSGWKALIEEDRLLSRIETLESQLQACAKNVTEEKLRDEIMKLQDDKDKYQNSSKESLRKVIQEKLEAIRRVQDLESSLSNTEDECSHLREVNKNTEKELQYLIEKSSENEKEISELTKKLQEAEEKYQELINQAAEDKLVLESHVEEVRKQEQVLSAKIEALQAENDFAKEQLTAMKARFEALKKGQNLDEKAETNGVLSDSQDHLDTSEKELIEKRNLVQELSSEVNRLELELQRVQEENKKNETQLTIIYPDREDSQPNGDLKLDYASQLQTEIQQLKKLLAETRENKKITDAELVRLKGQLDEAQNSAKKSDDEVSSLQQQLLLAKQNLKDKSEQVLKLKEQLSATGDGSESKEYTSPVREKPEDHDNQQRQEEVEKLHRRLHEAQQQAKQSQNEAEQLKRKADDLAEELQNKNTDNKTAAEFDCLREECGSLYARIQVLEAEIKKYRNENVKLEADYKLLYETCAELEAAKIALENKSGDYWKEQVVRVRSEADQTQKQLSEACEEIVLVKERYAECNQEKSHLQREVNILNEQLQLLSVQSKTMSVCSTIPLIILLLAVVLAFYPSLAHLTATSDQT